MKHLVLGVIGAAILAGCGGSDSEDHNSGRSAPPSADARLTSDEFLRRVDALCKDANPELAEIRTAVTHARDAGRAGRVGLPKTFDVFAMLLRRASAATERFEARLRSIEAPRRERAFYDALIDSVEEASSNLRQQVSAAEAQDAGGLRQLSVEGSLIEAERKGLIGGHGGFQSCGRG